MNERIKDLLPNPFAVDYQYKDGPLDLYTEKEMIRFAELIVRECINQASISNGHGNNQWDKALTFAANNIKEHFGVEE